MYKATKPGLVSVLSINQFIGASDHMDPYHNKRKYEEMIE